jgi:hypothetical protein
MSSMVTEIVDKVSGPICRSVGLLVGRVHLTGSSRTLVGGDPWVPMFLTMAMDEFVAEISYELTPDRCQVYLILFVLLKI